MMNLFIAHLLLPTPGIDPEKSASLFVVLPDVLDDFSTSVRMILTSYICADAYAPRGAHPVLPGRGAVAPPHGSR